MLESPSFYFLITCPPPTSRSDLVFGPERPGNLRWHLAGPSHVAGLGSCLCMLNSCPMHRLPLTHEAWCKQRSDPPLGEGEGCAQTPCPDANHPPLIQLPFNCTYHLPLVFLQAPKEALHSCQGTCEEVPDPSRSQISSLGQDFRQVIEGVCVFHTSLCAKSMAASLPSLDMQIVPGESKHSLWRGNTNLGPKLHSCQPHKTGVYFASPKTSKKFSH